MKMFPIANVLDSKGQPILLNEREMHLAQRNQLICNDYGFQIDVTTLTAITKRVVEQKFFTILPADYFAVRAGEGAWAQFLTTYKSYNSSGSFEEGIINMGGNTGRIGLTNVEVEAVNVPIKNWARELQYTIYELQQAALAGNWDLVTALESSRKQAWDLGIQRVAFLGGRGMSDVMGFLTMTSAGVNANTSIITKALSSMTSAELNTVLSTIIQAYRANSNYTAWPDTFTIPESDYNGLASQMSDDFPIKTKLAVITEAFVLICRNPNFKILPCAYADVANSDGALTQQTYVLSRYDELSVRMDIPVDYTATLANSFNNFSYQNVGYGQFTGCYPYRPLEVLYFRYTPS